MDLEKYLYDRVLPIILGWNEEGVYAISFYVDTNDSNEFQGICDFPEFSICYNTEKDCEYAPQLSEERWNYAFWKQDVEEIIYPEEGNEGAEFLAKWLRKNEGSENGYEELFRAVSHVARRLQESGMISERFGKIPIIVHELEYPDYVETATRYANPGGEAEAFLKYTFYGENDDDPVKKDRKGKDRRKMDTVRFYHDRYGELLLASGFCRQRDSYYRVYGEDNFQILSFAKDEYMKKVNVIFVMIPLYTPDVFSGSALKKWPLEYLGLQEPLRDYYEENFTLSKDDLDNEDELIQLALSLFQESDTAEHSYCVCRRLQGQAADVGISRNTNQWYYALRCGMYEKLAESTRTDYARDLIDWKECWIADENDLDESVIEWKQAFARCLNKWEKELAENSSGLEDVDEEDDCTELEFDSHETEYDFLQLFALSHNGWIKRLEDYSHGKNSDVIQKLLDQYTEWNYKVMEGEKVGWGMNPISFYHKKYGSLFRKLGFKKKKGSYWRLTEAGDFQVIHLEEGKERCLSLLIGIYPLYGGVYDLEQGMETFEEMEDLRCFTLWSMDCYYAEQLDNPLDYREEEMVDMAVRFLQEADSPDKTYALCRKLFHMEEACTVWNEKEQRYFPECISSAMFYYAVRMGRYDKAYEYVDFWSKCIERGCGNQHALTVYKETREIKEWLEQGRSDDVEKKLQENDRRNKEIILHSRVRKK